MMRPTRCVESFASRAPASLLLAGVAFPPVAGNGIAGAGEPFFVASKLFECFRGKEFRAVAGGVAQRLQQTCCNKHGNLVWVKSKKPCRLRCVQSGGNNLPTEKLGLLRGYIHTWTAARRLCRGEWVWVCFSEVFCSVASGASASTWLGAWFLVRSSFSSISLWRRVNCW